MISIDTIVVVAKHVKVTVLATSQFFHQESVDRQEILE